MDAPRCTGPGDSHETKTYIPEKDKVAGKHPYLCMPCCRKLKTKGLPYQWPPPGEVTSSNPTGE